MVNLRELQAQARNLERSGQHAAALELYGRILEEPAAERDGGMWARAARLQLALGDEVQAANSYWSAAERYDAAGHGNLALAHCQHALRSDASQPELLLQFGRLAASQGYPRDARHGFVEYADHAAAADDVERAAEALREYLKHFPSDDAVRRRLTELTGEEVPPPEAAAAPEQHAPPHAEALPGLTPTALAVPDQELTPQTSQPDLAGSAAADGAEPQVERLEGFEPTHAPGVGEEVPAGSPGSAATGADEHRPATAEMGAQESADEEEEQHEGEPLPLLGFEMDDATTAADGAAGSFTRPASRSDVAGEADGATDELPLMDPGSSSPAPSAGGSAAVARARERVRAEPDSLPARRELIRMLQDAGDPAVEGELADAEQDFAAAGRAAEALEFVEALARMQPQDTGLQQRRVERALRAGNRTSLIAGYLTLAGRFEAELQTERAQDALRSVLELDPANEQARAALTSATAAARPPQDYVDLGELILSGAPEEVTRFQVSIGDPTGDEESDFAEILDLFRKKISESLDPKDAASHYDLGLAFKEMGLLDDAIVHLQSGLRGGANPLATLEVLGECFVMKGQVSLASRVFERATRLEGVGDSDLVGVLYGLARSQEEMGQTEEARGTLERVVAVDLSFRDAAERLQRLQSR